MKLSSLQVPVVSMFIEFYHSKINFCLNVAMIHFTSYFVYHGDVDNEMKWLYA